MIPAILSVVFVIYLYQSLKETPDTLKNNTTGDSSNIPADELVARLRMLQSRVEHLANSYKNKGGV